jgi:Sec-independent protein translocase protein TatA
MSLGIGPLELLVVLLVAFIFLGPERMIDAARLLGKASREVRRLSTELSQIDLNDDETTPGRTDPIQRGVGSSGSSDPEAITKDADSPVSFQPVGEAPAEEKAEPPPEKDRA